MAEETQRYRIEVVVDPKPGDQGISIVEKRLVSLETAADRLRRLLRNLFFFAGLGASVRQLFDLSDAYTRIENRVRLVTRSEDERRVVLDRLFEVSNRVRTGTEQIGELYVRTALSAKNLGRSQQELLNFTESVSQALILSGASAQEANAGLVQLSQGISANRLGGDELRSVLEQLPAVADVLAQSLGVTRAQLRQMGAEGKITAEVILNAFRDAREELAGRFGATVPTIGQSFQVLKNRLLEFVGNANRATGASKLISEGILKLAEDIDRLARSVVLLSVALGTTLVVSGIQRAIAAMRAFSVVLLTNPLTLLPAVLALVIGYFVAFGDQVQVASDKVATLQDFAVAAFQVISERLAPMIELLKDAAASIGLFGSEAQFSFEGMVRGAAITVDAIVGLFRGLGNAISVLLGNIPTRFKDVLNLATFAIREFAEKSIDFILAQYQTLGDTIIRTGGLIGQVIANYSAALGALSAGNAEAAQDLTETAENSLNLIGQTFKSFPDRFRQNFAKLSAVDLLPVVELTGGAQILGDEVGAAFKEGFVGVTGATDLVDDIFDRAEERGRKRAAEQAAEAARLAAVDLNAPGESKFVFTDQQLDLLGQITGQTKEYKQQIADLNILYQQGAITLEQYQRTQDQLTIKSLQNATDMESGFKRAFLSMSLEATNFADATERAMESVADFGTDALVDLARTGGENFKQLADQAVQELQRIIARLIVVNLLKAAGEAIGGPVGGIVAGAAGGSVGKAVGGTVQPDRSYLVGERGPELFQPRQTGSIVPNAAIAGPTKPPQVNVQVVNVSDPNEVPSAIEGGGADRAIINVLQRNKAAVAQVTR